MGGYFPFSIIIITHPVMRFKKFYSYFTTDRMSLLFLQDFNNFLQRTLKFFVVGIVKKDQILFLGRIADALGDGEVALADVFVPVFQLPCISVAVSGDHPLMADFGVGDNPDNAKLHMSFGQRSPEGTDIFRIAHFPCKWGIDQHNIIVFQSLQSQIQDGFIFIVPDIFFKKSELRL